MAHGQSTADYKKHLQDTVNALALSSQAYDAGFEGEAKRLAATIRVLVHDTKASKSLLGQMNLKQSIQYYVTPNPSTDGNLLTECHLVLIAWSGPSANYKPLLDDFPPVFAWSAVSFDSWWNERVVRDSERREMSRKDLVLALANKDGGAHVDPQLNAVYADLSRNNSLAWQVVTDDVASSLDPGPELACVRQIAHELLKSIVDHTNVAPLRS